MSQKRLYQALIFFTILGVIISQTLFIPSWETQHMILFFSAFALAAIVGIWCMIRLWSWNYKYKDATKPAGWFSPQVFSFLIIVGLPIAFFLSILNAGHGFMGPSLSKQLTLGEKKIYVYNDTCFDSVCCETSRSLVYSKNTYLPIMHLLAEVDFHVGDVRLLKQELIISSSNICSKDKDKIKKVSF